MAYSCEEDGKFGGLDSTAKNHVIKAYSFVSLQVH